MARRFIALERLCEDAVEGGATPGLVVLAACDGQERFQRAFGHRQVEPKRLRATVDTVFDVASLTKPLVTTVLAMQMVGRGALALDDAVAARLPEFRGPGKARTRVRHLLAHAAGLPSHRPFWRLAADAASQRWAIELLAAREPIERPAGARSLYSDVGFIVLGWLLERTAGLRLDAQADRGIFGPLGLRSTTFVNLADAEARARLLANRPVAATERCPERKRVVVGEVHDLNAHAMGGIAGHAGLFSTAVEVSAVARALCAAWSGQRWAPGAPSPIVERDVLREFWRPAGIPGSTWRLGWDGPAKKGSLAGRLLSRRAVGHLAFTGCSLWIDPERAAWVVVLANRVHPEARSDPRFRALRPALNDAALEAMGYRRLTRPPRTPARRGA